MFERYFIINRFSANPSMSASTRKKKTFDPFACACTYACVKAVFTMKLDLLALVLASPMETRFKKCFDHLFYCINYYYFFGSKEQISSFN